MDKARAAQSDIGEALGMLVVERQDAGECAAVHHLTNGALGLLMLALPKP